MPTLCRDFVIFVYCCDLLTYVTNLCSAVVPLAVALVSWVLFSTEEIGRVIEEPFGNDRVRAPPRKTAVYTPSSEVCAPQFGLQALLPVCVRAYVRAEVGCTCKIAAEKSCPVHIKIAEVSTPTIISSSQHLCMWVHAHTCVCMCVQRKD